MRAAALACISSIVILLAGCGGSSEQTSEPITSKPTASGKQIARLKQQIADAQAQDAAPTINGPMPPASAGHQPGRPDGPPSGSPVPTNGASEGLAGLDALGDQLGAEVGVAIGPPGGGGPTATGGSLTSGSAWSTIKVPIALRVLEDAGGPDAISSTQTDLINRAITLSDNEAAAELFGGLEQTHGGLVGASAAVQDELRDAGDGSTVVSTQGRGSFSTYGQTEWSLTDQERFMAALAGGCISSPATRDYLLTEMGQVTSDPWGFGSAGVPAHWKGGWGPGTDGRYLLRQMGTMDLSGHEVVMSIAVLPDNGDFATGQEDASEVAQWVAARAGPLVDGPTGC